MTSDEKQKMALLCYTKVPVGILYESRAYFLNLLYTRKLTIFIYFRDIQIRIIHYKTSDEINLYFYLRVYFFMTILETTITNWNFFFLLNKILYTTCNYNILYYNK